MIREARRRRRSVLTLREDEEWLRGLTPNPRRLVQRMAERGALRALGRGRYAIAGLATESLEEAASWQVLADGLLSPYGDYYLGYLTALVEHRLTDVEEATIYAALRGRSRTLGGELHVGRRPLVVTFVVDRKWFGVEPVRVARAERYFRSDVERALVDCLDRPQLCGSTELYVRAWQRALSEERVNLDALCAYAARMGAAVAQRTGLLLSLTGRAEEAKQRLAPFVGRKTYVLFDPSARFAGVSEKDPTWRVILNVPRNALEGWLLAWE